jgi:hypothetical protein
MDRDEERNDVGSTKVHAQDKGFIERVNIEGYRKCIKKNLRSDHSFACLGDSSPHPYLYGMLQWLLIESSFF